MPHILRGLRTALLGLCAVMLASGFRTPCFSRLSVEDGLSQNTVFTICQDSCGMMWFGTMDGLSRYDGYEFRVWRNSAGDTTSLSSDIVKQLYAGADGRVWVGTGKGLSLYRPESGSFRNWNVGEISGIAPSDDGKLYVAAGGRFRIFDFAKDEWRDGGLGGGVVPSVLCRDGDCLWIGSRDAGLFRMDVSGGDVRRVPEFSSRALVTAVLRSGRNLWVATEGDGLWRLEIDGKVCVRAERTGQKDGLPSNFVRSLSEDGDGRLWAGTYGGLCIFDGKTLLTVRGDAFREDALSQNSVRSICRDSQGGMWLGTYYGGVNWWHPLKNRFETLRREPSARSLNDNVVNCISEDSSGRLWIGTNTGGVNCWNPASGTFRYWSVKTAPGGGNIPETDDVKALWTDDAGRRVYVGAHAGGLSRIDMSSGAVTKFATGASAENPGVADVYSIIPSAVRGRLWVGTLGGLRVFDCGTGVTSSPAFAERAEKYSAMPVRVLLLSGGRLWAGGDEGLQVFAADGSSLSLCPDVSSPSLMYVQSLLEVPGKYVWVGTRDGLWRYGCADGEWRRFSAGDGLPGNIICGMVADRYGMIWISTDKGISRFNPFSGSFRNYTDDDGLPSNQFNPSSALGRGDGGIMFGGSGGITFFNPEQFSDNPYSPKPVITGFSLTGKSGSGDIWPRNGEVRLSHDRNSFALSFSVPNYLSGRHNTFAYILEGYDDGWTVTGSRTALWSNLPHGDYVFRLKAANGDGKWCDGDISLRISIAPVWWRTVPAIASFALLTVLLVAGLCVILVRRKDRQRENELETREKSHQEEIQQMKTQFFINISHEMRSPLMLIINPLSEMIARCNDTSMRRQLRYLDRNARRLLHLVNQLIDYRRAELGVFRLRVRPEPVLKLVRENWSAYEPVARKKGLKYRLDSPLGDETACLDAQYIELILSNLLSNAFKYTESGSVTLYAGFEGDSLVLRVSDTGSGIPAELQGRIFERFYQVERDYVGSGIGLSLVQRLVELHHGTIELESEPGRGSVFTVRLPRSADAYSPEETGDGSAANSKELYAPEPEGDEVESLPSAGETLPADETGGVLLIVEDNQEMAVYLRDALSDSFEIRVASNGEEALGSVGVSKPDVVITEMNLPVMDGLKLCAQIKRDIDASGIPVIVISSSTDEKDQLAAFRAGADDFISKPFSLAVLQTKIRNMLRTRARLMSGKSSSEGGSWGALTAYDEELLAKAAAIVAKNMDNADFSTSDFAAEMNMSRSSLHIKLKALTGESALDFIRRIRFKEACRLLKEGRHSVSVISELVGFNSPSYFATCFKRYMGCLPSEWGRRP